MKENKVNDLIVKIGITPSNAPFRITCLRTFIYIYAIAEKNAMLGGNSRIIFQIDDTNEAHRLHSNEEIINFYKKMGILPAKYSNVIITSQTDIKNKCVEYLTRLQEIGFIIYDQENNVYAFDLEQYKNKFGNKVYVNDAIKGLIVFDIDSMTTNNKINIRRSDGTFLYNFSSAIDTIYWKFTHLIRGNNKLSSAAFQNMFIMALGYETPLYFHMPLLLEEKKDNPVNARDDFRKLLYGGISYMGALNYILNTGYGDNMDFYPSIESFIRQFDIAKLHKTDAHFDYNLLKKTNNRFYQNNMSYNEYYNQLEKHINILEFPQEILKYAYVGYANKLSVDKIIELYTQMNEEHFDELQNAKISRLYELIKLLMNNYDDTIELILKDKENRKEDLKLIRYILCGYLEGLSCNVYKQCYNNEEYQKRLKYVGERTWQLK